MHHLNLRNREASADVWDIFGLTIGCGNRCQILPENNLRVVATTISFMWGNWVQMQCHLNHPPLPPRNQLLCCKTQVLSETLTPLETTKSLCDDDDEVHVADASHHPPPTSAI